MKSSHLGQMFRVVCLATSVGMMGLLQACASAPPEENPVSISAPVGLQVQYTPDGAPTQLEFGDKAYRCRNEYICDGALSRLDWVGTKDWIEWRCRIGPADDETILRDAISEFEADIACCGAANPSVVLSDEQSAGLAEARGRFDYISLFNNWCDPYIRLPDPPIEET